jgi:hypothetical protein
MDNGLAELWQEIVARPSGRMAFRFYLQPLVAMLLASRDGIRDARAGNPAYFWAFFTGRLQRRELMRDGWRSIKNVFIVALVVDFIYQLVVLRGLRPGEGLLVAIAVAIVPYVLLRGPANRLARTVMRASKRRRSTI